MVVPVSPARRIPVELVVKLAEGESVLEQGGQGLLENGVPFVRFARLLPEGAVPRMSFPRFARRLLALGHPLARPGGGGSLDRFLRVRLPPEVDDVRDLLARLRARPDVEQAVLALPTRPCSPVVTDYQAQQDYLAESPVGVGPAALWGETDGAGVCVCVCDTAYDPHESLQHVEFLADTAMPGTAAMSDASETEYRHGTAALGVIGARPFGPSGEEGTRGIAYGARLAFSAVKDEASMGEAIDRALGETPGAGEGLVAGDVLVLEHEAILPEGGEWIKAPTSRGPKSFPVEVNPDVFRAIRVAVARGIAVVEPAGNGRGSLEGCAKGVDPDGEYFEWDPSVHDSGAIVVGGGTLGADGATRVRWREDDGMVVSGTNYGPRVDCHASASAEVTACSREPGLGGAVLNPNCPATEVVARWFSATSGATAIVGGVVALLQAAHKRRLGVDGVAEGPPADPLELRDLLRNEDFGWPQTFRPESPYDEAEATHRIGPQPDLAKAAPELPSTALVLLRDDVEGLNDRARRFYKFLCPDILVPRRGPPPPPFDHPEMRHHAFAPADALPGGIVRVRVRNRTPEVRDVEVALWWSEPSPFLHPRFWRALGRMPVDDIRPGRVKVSRPWSLPADIPGGPLSWIAGIADEVDGNGFPGADASTEEYLDFLRGPGKLRMLSRQRRALVPGEGARFRMRLRGMPEGRAAHELRFGSGLPDRARVSMDAGRLGAATGSWTVGELRRGPLRLDLGADDDVEVLVRVTVPPGPAFDWTPLAIDQVVADRQLGRITFEVARGDPDVG